MPIICRDYFAETFDHAFQMQERNGIEVSEPRRLFRRARSDARIMRRVERQMRRELLRGNREVYAQATVYGAFDWCLVLQWIIDNWDKVILFFVQLVVVLL